MDTPSDNLEKTFCSSRGIVISLKPVSQFKIDAVRSSRVVIEPPTYEMNLAGGEKRSHPLDETIAKNQDRMDEWNDYLAKRREQDVLQTKHFSELLIWEGVEVEVPGEDSEWQKTSEHFGMVVPSNPIERKLAYVYNELVGTGEDLGNLISQILSVSQVDQEVVDRIRSHFRSAIHGRTDRPKGKKSRKVEEL